MPLIAEIVLKSIIATLVITAYDQIAEKPLTKTDKRIIATLVSMEK